jgi:glycosyltransferase involved in cell wall biosynthesis
VAFENIADRLGAFPDVDLTVFGSGDAQPGKAYDFVSARCIDRTRFERFPRIPMLRSEWQWEESTFAASLVRKYHPDDFDLTMACSFPYSNLLLTRRRRRGMPKHVFITQNGDYPAAYDSYETKLFTCDGLVCTNPDYYDRNVDRWNSVLIPNGVDPAFFSPGPGDRARFDLPADAPLALMVSAMIDEKRVDEGIRAASLIDDLHLVVCGDGPERDRLRALADELMPGRYHPRQVDRDDMPLMYRSADVFLHMSTNEPSANAYIEALATAIPIVTHRRRVTEWTLGDTSYLVDTSTPGPVAAALRGALAEDSPERVAARRQMVAERFDWDVLAAQYDAFNRAVLAGAPAAGIGARP